MKAFHKDVKVGKQWKEKKKFAIIAVLIVSRRSILYDKWIEHKKLSI